MALLKLLTTTKTRIQPRVMCNRKIICSQSTINAIAQLSDNESHPLLLIISRLLDDTPIIGVTGVMVGCDRQLFDEFMRHRVCAVPFKNRHAGAQIGSGSLVFFIDSVRFNRSVFHGDISS